jgi:hypothetical protein
MMHTPSELHVRVVGERVGRREQRDHRLAADRSVREAVGELGVVRDGDVDRPRLQRLRHAVGSHLLGQELDVRVTAPERPPKRRQRLEARAPVVADAQAAELAGGGALRGSDRRHYEVSGVVAEAATDADGLAEGEELERPVGPSIPVRAGPEVEFRAGDSLQEVVEGLSLRVAQRSDQLLTAPERRLASRRELGSAGGGEEQRVTASIIRGAAPLEQSGRLQLVDRRDQPARVEPKRGAELLLGRTVGEVDRVHEGEVLRPEPQGLDRLGEADRLTASDLAQQVGDPGLERRPAPRGAR